MASSFMGLYVQREALITSQKALDITGNNISNVKTEGYSRQRVDVCSVKNTGYNLLYNTSVSMAGQGVDPVGVTQYRDSLLDTKVRGYTTSYLDFSIKTSYMSQVETALDNIEAEEFGLATNLNKFKEALNSFSNDNTDRNEVANISCEAAKSVVKQINYLDSRLTEISEQVLGDAKSASGEINNILKAMGSLNEQISLSYVSMGYISAAEGNYVVDNEYGPLELKDEMNLLVDTLAEFGPVHMKEENNGSFTISFAGEVVVHNEQYAQVAMTKQDPAPGEMEFVVSKAGTLDKLTDDYSHLKTAEEWQDIADLNGSTEEYVRKNCYDSELVTNITSEEALSSGGIRGLLDVYNGAGFYAETIPFHFENYEGSNLAESLKGELSLKIQTTPDEKIIATTKLSEINFDPPLVDSPAGSGNYFMKIDGKLIGVQADDTIGDVCELISNDSDLDANLSFNISSQEFEFSRKEDAGEVNISGKLAALFKGPYTGQLDAKLSTLGFAPDANGQFNVNINGKDFVFEGGNTIKEVMDEIAADSDVNINMVYDPMTEEFRLSEKNVSEEILNGNTYQGIEFYRGMLNNLSTTISKAFNSIYEEEFGFTLFTYDGYDKDSVTDDGFKTAAGTLRVSDDWAENPSLIASPYDFPAYMNNESGDLGDKEELNNLYINKMLGVINSGFTYSYNDVNNKTHTDPKQYNFEEYVAHISDNLGTQIEGNNKLLETTGIMLETVENSRDEVMGVSISEEGINMMNYQKWYNAIARMVTTLDEALDKVINGMGIVGR